MGGVGVRSGDSALGRTTPLCKPTPCVRNTLRLTQWRLTAKGAALASSLAVVLALAGCAQLPASPVELVRPGYAPAYPTYDPPDERAEAASKLCRPMPPGVR